MILDIQEQVKKGFCYQKLFGPFSVWINCSSDRDFFLKFEAECSEFAEISIHIEKKYWDLETWP